MATYVPNAANLAEPVITRSVESAAQEFRTLKSAVAALSGTLVGGSVGAIVTQQEATGDGVSAVFNLALPVDSYLHLDLYIDGIHQQPSSYTVLGSTLTFSEIPRAGALICIKIGKPIGVDASDSSLVTYVPGTSGQVSTTVQAKLRESVSVKDFGAVGDGITDDTAAFNMAWTASNPKAVFVPACTYEITSAVTGKFYSFGVVTINTGSVTSIVNLVP